MAAVLCNWNGLDFVGRCLDALAAQSHTLAEVVVVDNGSSDGSLQWIRRHHPEVRLLVNERNLGVAAGYNQAIAAACGYGYVLVLNTDVRLAPDFVEHGLTALRAAVDTGVVTGRFFEEGNNRLINGGFFLRRQIRIRPGPLAEEPLYLFGATGAAALFRTAALAAARLGESGYFDEDYFAYGEDIDLSWRLQLSGWRMRYIPEMYADHVGSGSLGGRLRFLDKPAFFQRHTLKNRYLTVIKNATPAIALQLLPALLLAELLLWPFLLLRQPLRFPYLILAWVDVVRLLPAALNKRSEIQRRRRVTSAYIRQFIRGI